MRWGACATQRFVVCVISSRTVGKCVSACWMSSGSVKRVWDLRLISGCMEDQDKEPSQTMTHGRGESVRERVGR